ncbi:MAG: glycosyltransferase family 9 protein [Victivallaceae bacterium]|nr:glycosyltransferase family 9 protein [Victivallaceae bacterium]
MNANIEPEPGQNQKFGHHSRRIKHVRRILIIKPSSMGDIMHTFRAVQLLSECYPKAVFDWLINPEFEELLSYSPVTIADVVLFNRRVIAKPVHFFPELFMLLRGLRRYRYDLVVDFQGLLRSALLTFASRHRHSCGFADPRESAARHWYHRLVKVSPECVHAEDRNLALAGYYCDHHSLQRPFQLPHNQRNMNRADRKLEHRRIPLDAELVAIFPGARWPSKTFPAQLFADVINRIHQARPELVFLIMGSMAENAAASAVRKLTGSHAHNFAGTTRVGEMVELIRKSSLVISNDSGPLHIAATMGVPSLGFFGATDPAKTGPKGNAIKVFERQVPCLHCMKRDCSEASELCFQLPVDEIVASALAMLKKPVSNDEKTPEGTNND